jgi:hypothetical protein
MTQLDRSAGIPRLALDRTRSGRHAGSIGLVLLLALVLVGAGGGLLFAGRAYAEPYLFALLATLAMAGVFLLLALATGILAIGDKAAASPLINRWSIALPTASW